MNKPNKYLSESFFDKETPQHLTRMAHRVDLMDANEERQVCENMRRAAQSALVALAEPETLGNLHDFLMETDEASGAQSAAIESNSPTDTDAISETKELSTTRSSSKANYFGLIDELQVLASFPERFDESRTRKCLRKLKSQLSQIEIAPYLILKYVDSVDGLTNFTPNQLAAKRLSIAKKTYYQQRNSMVRANLRLVFTVAAKYRYLGLSFDDLVQEGNLGLIKAIEYFDANKGYRFSTYAFRVISQYIHAGLEKQSDLVRKPFHMLREKQLIDKTMSRLEQQHGRAVSNSEVAQHADVRPEFTHAILSRYGAMSADNDEITNHYPHETDITNDDEEQSRFFNSNTETLLGYLEILPDRVKKMIIMRFGLGLRKDFTLEEISQQCGLSRERVRQLINEGVSQIKDYYFRDE